MTIAERTADGAALHLVTPRIPTLNALGSDLLAVRRATVLRELALPVLLVGAFVLLAAHRAWPLAVVSVALFFPRFGVAFHDLLHESLGLGRRWNRICLSVVGVLALQSGHAVQAAHLEHHRRYPNEDDPEAYIGRLFWLRALAEGPRYQYRMWTWVLTNRPDLRPMVIAEACAHVLIVTGALAALPWTSVPAAYVVLMLLGDSVFPALSENFLHNQMGSEPQERTRTIRGRFFEAYFLELGYHLEHHMYPRVPTRNCRELSRRLSPHLSALGVAPLHLI